MLKRDFYELKVGDLVACKGGCDDGKVVRIIHIEDLSVLLKVLSGDEPFSGRNDNSKMKLTNYQHINKIYPKGEIL